MKKNAFNPASLGLFPCSFAQSRMDKMLEISESARCLSRNVTEYAVNFNDGLTRVIDCVEIPG